MNIFINTKTYNYVDYRKHVEHDLEIKLLSSDADKDEMIPYIQLNKSRMNRLDKTITLPEDVLSRLKALEHSYIFYVISEGWCGDAAQIVPIINVMVNAVPSIDLRIILRDDNLEIMDQYLTHGARSIPKLVIFDAQGNEVATWGPRPKAAAQLVIDLKEQYGGITQEVKEGLQKWYNTDKGYTTMTEILDLLK